jgi:hypothetical protein
VEVHSVVSLLLSPTRHSALGELTPETQQSTCYITIAFSPNGGSLSTLGQELHPPRVQEGCTSKPPRHAAWPSSQTEGKGDTVRKQSGCS